MSVPSWLSSPSAARPASPPPDREWRKRRLLCLSLAAKMREFVLEPGDAADEARLLAQSGIDAFRHHEAHGRNWWAKYGDELHQKVAPFFPATLPASLTPAAAGEELEGAALMQTMLDLFPDAAPLMELDRYYRRSPIRVRTNFKSIDRANY